MRKLVFCIFVFITVVFLALTIILLSEITYDGFRFDYEAILGAFGYAVGFILVLWLGHYFFGYKRILLTFIIFLIVISCLFPPWQMISQRYNQNIKAYFPVGYAFIATPPDDANTIDFSRLSIQIGFLFFLGCCIRYSGHIFHRDLPKTVSPDGTTKN
ncbi:MAG: hypothetical protein ABFD79_11955 [Phycisphaerales bacterium]